MKWCKPCFLLVIILLLTGEHAFSGDAGLTLTIHISGASPGKGQAFLSVFSSSENWLKKPLIKKSKPIDPNGRVAFAVGIPRPGEYAVSVIYDEDGNGKLNTGFLGIPSEPVGVSNSAKGVFGPPKYKDAAFQMSASRTIYIRLGKAKD